MTALTEFQRLEAAGSWRPGPEARLREVIVSVGDATLVLSDPKSETPLTHWSLPAVTRLNPGQVPAVFAPADDRMDEYLEIDDALMIEAIDRVHRAIDSRRAHPGRLRRGFTLAAALAMVLAVVLWLPGATIRYTARIAPPAQADAIAAMLLDDIEKSTGASCARASGQAVLDRLVQRVAGQHAAARIVPAHTGRVLALPGDNYVIGRDLIEDQSGPAVLAGNLIAAALPSSPDEILSQTLRQAGFAASLRLLTGGALPEDSLSGYGQTLLSRPPAPVQPAALTQRLAEIGVPIEPYLAALDADSRARITAAAPAQGNPTTVATDSAQPAALLTEQQWLALQQICE